jgi:hypothetical protein
MFVSFTDESGNDGQSQVFAMATIVLCHFSSYYFGNDWQSMLMDFSISEFHARDFHGGRGQFRWTDSRRSEFQQAVVNLFLKWEVKHSAVVVLHNDYRRAFVDTGFHKVLRPAIRSWKKPYLQAFQHTVLDLRHYADHQPKGHYIVPVFDFCQEFMGQAQHDYAERNKDAKLGNMHVSNTREYVQLQAADFLAWEYRVNAERSIRTGERNAGPVLSALQHHMFGAKIWSYAFLEYLRRRVEAVNSGIDPDSIPGPEGA